MSHCFSPEYLYSWMIRYVEGFAGIPEVAEYSRGSATLHLVLFKCVINRPANRYRSIPIDGSRMSRTLGQRNDAQQEYDLPDIVVVL